MKYIVGKKKNNELLCSFSKLLWLRASSGGGPLVFSLDCANQLGHASGWGFNALQIRVDRTEDILHAATLSRHSKLQ